MGSGSLRARLAKDKDMIFFRKDPFMVCQVGNEVSKLGLMKQVDITSTIETPLTTIVNPISGSSMTTEINYGSPTKQLWMCIINAFKKRIYNRGYHSN